MAAQAVIGGTVHTPLAQDVSGRGGTQLHPQHAVAHAVVHFGDLWPGLIGMGNQLQLYDPGPLDVLVAQLVGRHRLPLEHDGACDPGDDEIPELLGLPVEGADVTISRSVRPLEMEWYSMPSGQPRWIALVTLASTSRSGCVSRDGLSLATHALSRIGSPSP